jgi:hypothetical protein
MHARRLHRAATVLTAGALLLAAGCSSERTVSSQDAVDAIEGVTIPGVSIPDVTLPDLSIPDISILGISIPDISLPDVSLPDVSIPNINSPEQAVDFLVQQLELAGMNVDRACVEEVLKNTDLLGQVNQQQTVTPQMLQEFFGCLKL